MTGYSLIGRPDVVPWRDSCYTWYVMPVIDVLSPLDPRIEGGDGGNHTQPQQLHHRSPLQGPNRLELFVSHWNTKDALQTKNGINCSCGTSGVLTAAPRKFTMFALDFPCSYGARSAYCGASVSR